MMSAFLSPQAARGSPAESVIYAAGSAVGRWWVAYTAWRIERMTAARLAGMSDRQLKTLGIVGNGEWRVGKQVGEENETATTPYSPFPGRQPGRG